MCQKPQTRHVLKDSDHVLYTSGPWLLGITDPPPLVALDY